VSPVERGAALATEAGRNRVIVEVGGKRLAIDLAGRSHRGVATPHVVEYTPHVIPSGPRAGETVMMRRGSSQRHHSRPGSGRAGNSSGSTVNTSSVIVSPPSGITIGGSYVEIHDCFNFSELVIDHERRLYALKQRSVDSIISIG
jgi:Bacterial toxin 24